MGMFQFFKNLFKKKPEQQLTITINGESYTTENREEISEIMKQMSEALKAKNSS
jgi:hypothetical protein